MTKLTASGVRTIKVIPSDGSPPQLHVQIVIDGEVLVQLPGELVAPLRYMFSRVEAEHPGLCGTDEAARRAEGNATRATYTPQSGDPSLN